MATTRGAHLPRAHRATVRRASASGHGRYNTSPHQTAFCVSVEARHRPPPGFCRGPRQHGPDDHDPATAARPVRPGMFRCERAGGVLQYGHTEVSIDPARLSGLYPAAVICEVMDTDGSMARLPRLLEAAEHDLALAVRDSLPTACAPNGSLNGGGAADANALRHLSGVRLSLEAEWRGARRAVGCHRSGRAGAGARALPVPDGRRSGRRGAIAVPSSRSRWSASQQNARGFCSIFCRRGGHGLVNKLCAYELQDGGRTRLSQPAAGFLPDQRPGMGPRFCAS